MELFLNEEEVSSTSSTSTTTNVSNPNNPAANKPNLAAADKGKKDIKQVDPAKVGAKKSPDLTAAPEAPADNSLGGDNTGEDPVIEPISFEDEFKGKQAVSDLFDEAKQIKKLLDELLILAKENYYEQDEIKLNTIKRNIDLQLKMVTIENVEEIKPHFDKNIKEIYKLPLFAKYDNKEVKKKKEED